MIAGFRPDTAGRVSSVPKHVTCKRCCHDDDDALHQDRMLAQNHSAVLT